MNRKIDVDVYISSFLTITFGGRIRDDNGYWSDEFLAAVDNALRNKGIDTLIKETEHIITTAKDE